MKHITFFIQSLSGGGAEHQLSVLASFLLENGYMVDVASYADVEDHYSLSPGINRIRLAQNWPKCLKVLSLIRFFLFYKTDCFISFGQRENLMCLSVLQLRRGVKVIAGERNYTKLAPASYEKFLFNKLYKRANFIVPNSKSQAQYIIDLHPEYREKIVAIINYTDTTLYTCLERTINKPLCFAIFCRYQPQKNCLRFLDAVSEVLKQSKEPFIIEWFGNQDFFNVSLKKYFEQIKRKVEENGLQNVVFLNRAVKDVYARLPKYDAFILPSLHEGFSNSISEAICCGLPMIVSDVSDNSVMVRNGFNGFLFNPTDTEDMANAITKFLRLEPEEKLEMGRNSRKIAEQLFNKEKFTSAYINLIER